jgi:hypothetical protein
MSSIVVVHVNTQKVIILGGLLLLLGLTIAVLGWVGRYRMAQLVGVAHCSIVGLCVTAVNLFGWSPHKATIPFLWAGIVYNVILAPTSWITLRRAPRVYTPGLCRECGYSLRGLLEPRCPECGAGFDPSKVSPAVLAP